MTQYLEDPWLESGHLHELECGIHGWPSWKSSWDGSRLITHVWLFPNTAQTIPTSIYTHQVLRPSSTVIITMLTADGLGGDGTRIRSSRSFHYDHSVQAVSTTLACTSLLQHSISTLTVSKARKFESINAAPTKVQNHTDSQAWIVHRPQSVPVMAKEIDSAIIDKRTRMHCVFCCECMLNCHSSYSGSLSCNSKSPKDGWGPIFGESHYLLGVVGLVIMYFTPQEFIFTGAEFDALHKLIDESPGYLRKPK